MILYPGSFGGVLMYCVFALFVFVVCEYCATRAAFVPAAAMRVCALCKMCFIIQVAFTFLVDLFLCAFVFICLWVVLFMCFC